MSSDDDEEDFGEDFGQRHPPLYIYIKGILERYPDGQIFKVSERVRVDSCPHLFISWYTFVTNERATLM